MKYLEATIRDQNKALALAAATIDALRKENAELLELARSIAANGRPRRIAVLFMEAKARG